MVSPFVDQAHKVYIREYYQPYCGEIICLISLGSVIAHVKKIVKFDKSIG